MELLKIYKQTNCFVFYFIIPTCKSGKRSSATRALKTNEQTKKQNQMNSKRFDLRIRENACNQALRTRATKWYARQTTCTLDSYVTQPNEKKKKNYNNDQNE